MFGGRGSEVREKVDLNYYRRLARMYLGDYNGMRESVHAWAAEKKSIEAELSSVPVAISKYGGEPSGGTGELNVVEQQAQNRIELEQRLDEIVLDTKKVQAFMDKIENAVSSLDAETCQIVWEHYVEGIAWNTVGDRIYMDGKSAARRGQRAMNQIATILFGLKAQPYKQVVLIS